MTIPGAEDIADAVRAFIRAADAMQEHQAARAGLAVSDLRAMGYLMERPGMSPGDLARNLQVTSAAITFLLDRLSEAGITVRTPNPHDRRGSLIHLSEHGIGVYTATSDVLTGAVAEAAEGLTGPQLRALLRFLTVMTERCATH